MFGKCDWSALKVVFSPRDFSFVGSRRWRPNNDSILSALIYDRTDLHSYADYSRNVSAPNQTFNLSMLFVFNFSCFQPLCFFGTQWTRVTQMILLLLWLLSCRTEATPGVWGLAVTTNWLFAWMTIPVGICLAVTEPARLQCQPHNTVLTNSLQQHNRRSFWINRRSNS